jgi:hypothetical protein
VAKRELLAEGRLDLWQNQPVSELSLERLVLKDIASGNF